MSHMSSLPFESSEDYKAERRYQQWLGEFKWHVHERFRDILPELTKFIDSIAQDIAEDCPGIPQERAIRSARALVFQVLSDGVVVLGEEAFEKRLEVLKKANNGKRTIMKIKWRKNGRSNPDSV